MLSPESFSEKILLPYLSNSFIRFILSCDSSIAFFCSVRNPNIDTLIKKGEKLLKKGQFEDALSIFNFALKLNGKNEKLLEYKSIALNELDRFDEAYEFSNRYFRNRSLYYHHR